MQEELSPSPPGEVEHIRNVMHEAIESYRKRERLAGTKKLTRDCVLIVAKLFFFFF